MDIAWGQDPNPAATLASSFVCLLHLKVLQYVDGLVSRQAESKDDSPLTSMGAQELVELDGLPDPVHLELSEWDMRYELRRMTVPALRELARKHAVPGRSAMRKAELVSLLEGRLGLPRLSSPDEGYTNEVNTCEGAQQPGVAAQRRIARQCGGTGTAMSTLSKDKVPASGPSKSPESESV
ncbi:hypothetical protein V8C86DRAFT_2649550 [Haematococcus lacustris]